jgi:hypothetical protein
MNERRANLSRNILALGAMFGGMPIYGGTPRARPEPHPEAQALALDLGASYEDAERVWLRFGSSRAREVLTMCLEHGVTPSHELLRLLEPEPTTGEQIEVLLRAQREIDAFRQKKADTSSMLRQTVPDARQQRRALAERKARRAKRKQRGKR